MPPTKAMHDRNLFFVFIDFLMMGLLVLNLALITFDWIFVIPLNSSFFASELPTFFTFYKTQIHTNFFDIDMAFVAVFLIEFLISWMVAIGRKTYHKWFFYPFIHWYDLVGCIPLSSFRFVRILRVFMIFYRLHQLQVIDLSKSFIYATMKKYYEILVEEVSDRVVTNIIEEMQEEMRRGGPVLDTIVGDVLRPKQTLIVDWYSRRIGDAARINFARRKSEVQSYINNSIGDAFRKNEVIKRLERVPGIGKGLSETLEQSISGIIFNIIENAMADLASDRNRPLVEEATEIVFGAIETRDDEDQLHDIVLDTLIEILEVVKTEMVQVKRWKLRELAEANEKAANGS
ncbi:MAG: ion transporter [Proteobacteria bacterium]|nr:ion transporter [Pseudomonadota bacterium]